MDMYREEAYVLTVGKLISGVDKLTSSSDEVTPVTGAAITNHNMCTQQDKFVKFQEFHNNHQASIYYVIYTNVSTGEIPQPKLQNNFNFSMSILVSHMILYMNF